ncbi:hypothetical protein BJ878DRAFT_479408 [Calycina marina]|uniref:Uncharacterized protein n=1 Tax=Calycina marina TaxID=1763456 RepID=A0A9P7Z5G5_9HELO|nr:hypothetical protein BJ878DRAFT_479408 [Calycina marina]
MGSSGLDTINQHEERESKALTYCWSDGGITISLFYQATLPLFRDDMSPAELLKEGFLIATNLFHELDTTELGFLIEYSVFGEAVRPHEPNIKEDHKDTVWDNALQEPNTIAQLSWGDRLAYPLVNQRIAEATRCEADINHSCIRRIVVRSLREPVKNIHAAWEDGDETLVSQRQVVIGRCLQGGADTHSKEVVRFAKRS